MKRGETIRFTYNSSDNMRIVGSDTPFASSETASPREYIEVTFAGAGEYSYSDTGTKHLPIRHLLLADACPRVDDVLVGVADAHLH